MNVQNFSIGSGELFINGQSIGGTTEAGVVVTYEPDVHLHLSGKYGNTPVKASLIGQTLTLTVTMAESTKGNMEKAMAGTTQSGGKVMFGGVAGRALTGASLEVTPFDGTSSWRFRNAVPTSSVDTHYTVGDERVLEVTFTALVDTSAPAGEELGYVS
jgi:hypothetical protein